MPLALVLLANAATVSAVATTPTKQHILRQPSTNTRKSRSLQISTPPRRTWQARGDGRGRGVPTPLLFFFRKATVVASCSVGTIDQTQGRGQWNKQGPRQVHLAGTGARAAEEEQDAVVGASEPFRAHQGHPTNTAWIPTFCGKT